MHTNDTIPSMRALVDALKKDPKQRYSLRELAHFMPWAKSGRTVRKILDADRKGLNMLKCQITGVGNQRRYLVEGTHLISYLHIYGPGLMALVQKPKHYGTKKRDAIRTAERSKTQ